MTLRNRLFRLSVCAMILCLLGSLGMKVHAQNTEVEKSIWGIQIGPFHPLLAYNESKLKTQFALRSEISFTYAYMDNGFESLWALSPYVNLEPRYYYNLKRRVAKEKAINNNAGNYLSVCFTGQPGLDISNRKDVDIYPSISIIPSYGLKRNIGNHFNFECSFGYGLAWVFQKYEYKKPDNSIETHKNTERTQVFNLRLAIGYVF